ncbi:cobB [Symbiodinium sp. CCMP2592]|nr:cobB [Symbiodinium sp. CCMP2592]
MLADAPSVTDLEVCIIESHEPGTKVPPKKDKERQPKKNKDKGEEVEKTRKKKGRSRSPSLAVEVDAPPQVTDGEARKAQAGSADTAQAGVAAAAALGFNVLPKQSSYAPNAPAPGLRPSLHAPTALPTPSSTSLGHRVCVQYLCFTRCDRGSNCPEAHIMDPEEEMRVRAKFKMQECNQGANCTRTSCLFRHPGERVEEASLSGSQLQKATPQSGITR